MSNNLLNSRVDVNNVKKTVILVLEDGLCVLVMVHGQKETYVSDVVLETKKQETNLKEKYTSNVIKSKEILLLNGEPNILKLQMMVKYISRIL